MQAVFKTQRVPALAFGLALGCLISSAFSKPSLAFLGFDRESDPLIRDKLASRIQFELAADTGLAAISKSQVAALFTKGILSEPDVSPADLPRLSKELNAQYFAFGQMENLENVSKRIWWKPWRLKVTWSQDIRLRVLEASTGMLVYDGRVIGQLADKALLTGPKPFQLMSPLEKEGYLNRMLSVLALEASKTLAKAVKEKTAPIGAASTK